MTILVVEDNALNLELVRVVLAAGFQEVVTKPIDTRSLGALIAKYRSA